MHDRISENEDLTMLTNLAASNTGLPNNYFRAQRKQPVVGWLALDLSDRYDRIPGSITPSMGYLNPGGDPRISVRGRLRILTGMFTPTEAGARVAASYITR